LTISLQPYNSEPGSFGCKQKTYFDGYEAFAMRIFLVIPLQSRLRDLIEPVVLSGLPLHEGKTVWGSGVSADDFYLLCSGERPHTSRILRVVHDTVAHRHTIDAALTQIHVTLEGALWGLSETHAFRIDGNQLQTFVLGTASAPGTSWSGIGGDGATVLVWGTGGLLQFDPLSDGFVPFGDALLPNAATMPIERSESILHVQSFGKNLSVLARNGAVFVVVQFDGHHWLRTPLTGFDSAHFLGPHFKGEACIVLDSAGILHRIDANDDLQQALVSQTRLMPKRDSQERGETANAQVTYAFCPCQNGYMVADDRGFYVLRKKAQTSILYQPPTAKGATASTLCRLGYPPATRLRGGFENAEEDSPPVLALAGPYAWVFRDESFYALDLRAF
jgi:hypothetical protein